MDTRTSLLASSLDPLAFDLLLTLLERERAEKELVASVEGPGQPTVHKKLKKLAEIGLIYQASAGRGAIWRVAAPTETAKLLAAMIALGDALEGRDRQKRSQAKARLAAVGGGRSRLRLVDGKRSNRR